MPMASSYGFAGRVSTAPAAEPRGQETTFYGPPHDATQPHARLASSPKRDGGMGCTKVRS
jgi:hypothetical protein